ncbi:FISUMP domain-containing protein, partial [Dysgonomonas sp. 521]|uniref:FISUMP domain-containing protein n=1 Tax=Dysgonomonas sp. 521 TaxID=2302932 RepID=UPI0013D67FDA
MELTASHEDGTPTSYQWMIDGQTVTGTNAGTYSYTPPADLALEEDELGNRKKTVSIACRMEIGGKTVQSANYDVLVVHVPDEDKDGDGIRDLQPIYVNVWKDGFDGENNIGAPVTDLIKIAYSHVNLGAENETDPCNCQGDFYQWGRPKDGHEKITSGITSTESDVAPPGHSDFIQGFPNWFSHDDPVLWGNGSQDFNPTWTKPSNNPCPTGWKVPSQKQWELYKGEITSESFGSEWTRLGSFGEENICGYKVADALFLQALGGRYVYEGGMYGKGISGIWWTSTTSTYDYNACAYGIYEDYAGRVVDDILKGNGLSVRCIKDEVLAIDPKATVESCIPYMFTYQTMELTASHEDGTPTSYQWMIDGQTVTGTNAGTYSYTPPADLALEEDELGNRKKTVSIACRMEIGGKTVQS